MRSQNTILLFQRQLRAGKNPIRFEWALRRCNLLLFLYSIGMLRADNWESGRQSWSHAYG